MYFRLPIIIVFILTCIVGMMIFQAEFDKNIAVANGKPMAAEGLASREVTGTDQPQTEGSGVESILPRDLQAHVEFLADDLLEGRDTGSRGARIASMYIATQFERLGLKPVGEDSSYYQAVPLVRHQFSPKSEFQVEVQGEMVPLKYGSDFLIVKAPPVSGQKISASMVFSGFGIKTEDGSYNDYKDIDAQGKISVFVSGQPGKSAETMAKYASGSVKRKIAADAGATAAISVVRDEQLANFSWDKFENYLTSPSFVLLQSGQKADDEDDTGFAGVILHPKAAEILFSDERQNYKEVDEMAETGKAKSFAMKKKAAVTVVFDKEEVTDRNVVGFLEGSDPRLKSEVIVFTAHYDHVGIGMPVAGDSLYNGAADNASGTSGLLELAEAFASLPERPRRSMLFLAVTAEEKGLLGSKYYTYHPLFPLENTVANFNMDMIGIGDTTALVVYGIERSSLGEEIRAAASQFGLEVWEDDMPEERIFYRSDHYNFAKKGVPAIFPSFGMRRPDFDKLSKFYHQPSDDPNMDWLNYRYMSRHVRIVFTAAMNVANADEAPKWTAGDEFSKMRTN